MERWNGGMDVFPPLLECVYFQFACFNFQAILFLCFYCKFLLYKEQIKTGNTV